MSQLTVTDYDFDKMMSVSRRMSLHPSAEFHEFKGGPERLLSLIFQYNMSEDELTKAVIMNVLYECFNLSPNMILDEFGDISVNKLKGVF